MQFIICTRLNPCDFQRMSTDKGVSCGTVL